MEYLTGSYNNKFLFVLFQKTDRVSKITVTGKQTKCIVFFQKPNCVNTYLYIEVAFRYFYIFAIRVLFYFRIIKSPLRVFSIGQVVLYKLHRFRIFDKTALFRFYNYVPVSFLSWIPAVIKPFL